MNKTNPIIMNINAVIDDAIVKAIAETGIKAAEITPTIEMLRTMGASAVTQAETKQSPGLTIEALHAIYRECGNLGDLAMFDVDFDTLMHWRNAYGDKMIHTAYTMALRTNTPLSHTMRYCVEISRFNDAIANAGAAFAQCMQKFVDKLPYIETPIGDIVENRRERRSAKHSKRMKESDQSWKRRNRH